MLKDAFYKFSWGFLFILFSFRLQGIDIMPDVIGYILFAIGFHRLAEQSEYFARVKILNVIMIFLSIFSIYEQPAQGGGIHINPLGIVIGLVSTVLLIVIVYHLMMGIKDMAIKRERSDIEQEASQKWTYFLAFQIATLCTFVLIFIPPLFVVAVVGLFIASIVLIVVIMRFMRYCGDQL